MSPPAGQSASPRPTAPTPPCQAERPALRPPQFTLATLLWAVAVLGLLFAGMTAAGPLGALLLLLLALCIAAHVAGNAIGTRLRAIGSTPDPAETGEQRRPRRLVFQHEYAPAGPLCRRTAMSRIMIGSTVTGAVVGGTCGGAVLLWLTWGEVNIPTSLVAVFSSTVLGGFLGFAASSFAQIAGGAWREAGRKD